MKSPAVIAILCLFGIAASVASYGPALRLTASGRNDFLGLYPGGRLAGTSDLYNPASVTAVETEAVGSLPGPKYYCRLPYLALLLWPLGRLPYQTAYWIWEGLSLAAAVIFALLWKAPDRKAVILACCWSLPLFAALAGGQDVTFLLLWIALSLELLRRKAPFAAGLVFALCAAKFHLFLLFPLLIVAHRMWRFGAGLLAGGGVLLILSFVAGGAQWPQGYLAILSNPEASPTASVMPNLHGMFAAVPGGLIFELLASALAAAVVWVVVRRTALEYGFAAVMTGGLLVSRHAYLADCALLLPALLAVTVHATAPWLRSFALFLLTPVVYILVFMGPAIWATRVVLVLFLMGLAWSSRARPANR